MAIRSPELVGLNRAPVNGIGDRQTGVINSAVVHMDVAHIMGRVSRPVWNSLPEQVHMSALGNDKSKIKAIREQLKELGMPHGVSDPDSANRLLRNIANKPGDYSLSREALRLITRMSKLDQDDAVALKREEENAAQDEHGKKKKAVNTRRRRGRGWGRD